MSRFLPLLIVSLIISVITTKESWAVGGSSFAACVAEGEVSYAPATAATLSAAAGAESGIEAAGAAALASDLTAATSATAGCLGAVPCGIAASLGASAAAFPVLYGSAETALTPIAQTPGGVATGAFGGMGIVEPFSGPGYWIPVAGGLVLNLESYAVALHGTLCAAGQNINTALSAVASALSSDFHNTARLVDGAKTHLGLIRERLRMEREYQPEPTLCARSITVAQNGPVLASVAQTAGTIDSSLVAVDDGLPGSQILSSASSWPEPKASDLFGPGGYTLTPQEISSGIRTIWLMTHPTGHEIDSRAKAQTGSSVLPQTLQARESLIRHILTNLFALRVPPTPGGVSFMGNLSNQVQERWSNPQWLVGLHTLHPAPLRREIAMEKSLSEEIQYLRMLSKQHREALLAMIAAEGTDR
ncbi:MAG: hypothetical protein UBAL2_85240011 [Leptospirillum rubarum]|jgi:hypothetical protein|nr:MAG: hypothetical protein UBAL2_85240011 [Leptospirillum rubarum]